MIVTKSDRIVALHLEGKSVREIAIAIYNLNPGLPSRDIDRKAAYVRVVLRQRNPEGVSKYDRAYRQSERARAYHRDYVRRWQKHRIDSEPAFREMRLAAARAYKRRRRSKVALSPAE